MGSNGTILKTINGGETWTAQTSGISNSIWSVYFLNANRGWAVGNNGEILIAVDNVLPLRFTGFTVKKCGSNACLNWTTVNEENVDRIEIERSSDGRTLKKFFLSLHKISILQATKLLTGRHSMVWCITG